MGSPYLDLAAFSARYDTNGLLIAGEFSGNLDNGGEELTLSTAWGETLASFVYSDNRGWPLSTDGAGHALVPLDNINQAIDSARRVAALRNVIVFGE